MQRCARREPQKPIKEIAEAFARMGKPISKATIRRHLRSATQTIPASKKPGTSSKSKATTPDGDDIQNTSKKGWTTK